MTLDEKWLREWEAIMNRIESIDARLWQGAGIILVLSVGGISLLGWSPPISKADLVFAIGSGAFSILVLFVWWFIFHRWIYFQGIFNYRAREIEDELGLRANRYVRFFQYWKAKKVIDLSKREFKEKSPDVYDRFEKFWESHHKRRFSQRTILWSLRLLTIILGVAWIAFTIVHVVGFCWPTLLGLR